MHRNEFMELLRRYRDGTATAEERRFIESYYDLFEAQPGLEAWMNGQERSDLQQRMLDGVWEKVVEEESRRARAGGRPRYRWTWAAAAALLAGVAALGWLAMNRRAQAPEAYAAAPPAPAPIRPGGHKAVLTLAGGQQLFLGDSMSGTLARQGQVQLRQTAAGTLVYDAAPAEAGKEVPPYNTLTIPRGGEYRLVLSDGTAVWLNAGSTLRYPAAFTGTERRVVLSGEAYFEASGDPRRPFIVEIPPALPEGRQTEVRVLGTRFNVKAYREDREVRTSLAEGAVRMSRGRASRVLRPGEEGRIGDRDTAITVSPADLDMALAWKNGTFFFNHTNIRTIMQELSRWYDVDVEYETRGLDDKNFSGIVSRYGKAEALLKRLELTGTVHFRIEGRTVKVLD